MEELEALGERVEEEQEAGGRRQEAGDRSRPDSWCSSRSRRWGGGRSRCSALLDHQVDCHSVLRRPEYRWIH